MNVRSKNPVRIFGAAAISFIAVHAGGGQIQQVTADEGRERIIAETPAATSHDPDADSMSLDRQEETTLTPSKKTSKHPAYPGMDYLDHFHQAASDSLDGTIDACSLVCLSCHDGINAPETKVKTVGEWDVPFDFDNHCHPLGIRYDPARPGKTVLAPKASLPPEIILPEGKVGCESCHNLHSSEPHFLVFSNLDGGLCLGCHIK